MAIKARVGFTKSFIGEDGKPAFLGLLDFFKGISEIAQYQVFPEHSPEVTPAQVSGFDIVVTRTVPRWAGRSLKGNERLLAVLRVGVGYDGINVSDLTEEGTMVCITPAAVRRPIAGAIVTLILALSSRLLTKDRMTRQGQWGEVFRCFGYGLNGKSLGSIGVGNIGHEVFRLIKPFGMRHLAYDPYVTQDSVTDVNVQLVDLDTVLGESDFVSISCPLAAETRHLVGEKELGKMKRTAFLINTARGPIVDESALIRALHEGWIQGAGLDVFEHEPTSPDNPLLKMDNVIVTAHALGITDEYIEGVWNQIHRQILQIIEGEVPEGLLNRQVLDKPAFRIKLERFLKSLTE